ELTSPLLTLGSRIASGLPLPSTACPELSNRTDDSPAPPNWMATPSVTFPSHTMLPPATAHPASQGAPEQTIRLLPTSFTEAAGVPTLTPAGLRRANALAFAKACSRLAALVWTLAVLIQAVV